MRNAMLPGKGPRWLATATSLTLALAATPAHGAADHGLAENGLPTAAWCAMQALSPAAAAPLTATKSGALLGGAPSALDAIRAQQAAFVPLPPASMLAAAAPAARALTPGVDASKPAVGACRKFVAPSMAALPGSPENFLASKRIGISRTSFDADWKRVRGERLSPGAAQRYVGGLSGSREQSLAAVNRLVNQRIRYTEDRDQYGKSDFWAGAKRTLSAGRGDCEDIAIVKMHLLAAVGVPRDDMILTIARDLVRNADHAVLIVRTDAGYRMLDNATDTVLDAATSHDYRAILSLGSHSSWLHGV